MISQKDWIPETAWRDMYLTPTGWIRGTIRDEKGRFEFEVEPPDDCLLIVRFLEKVPKDPLEKQADWSEIKDRSKDTRSIEQAQEKWGVLPLNFPPLSLENASSYQDIKTIRDMRKPRKDRPVGSRIRPDRW